jgi:hypothetical protein
VTSMFERFTDKARRVLVLAQEHAKATDAMEITSVHMLLALTDTSTGTASRVLSEAGVDAGAILDEFPAKDGGGHPDSFPFSKVVKKMLEVSLREALQLGHNHIGTEHMLLALLRAGGPVGEWLVERGVTREVVLAAIPGEPVARRRVYPRRTGRVTEAPTPHEMAKMGADAIDMSARALVALAAEDGSAAQQVLASFGIDSASLADAVRRDAAESASADGAVVLDLGDGEAITVEAGELAGQLRGLLRPLVEKGVVTGHIGEDATFHASVPGMRETVVVSASAWLEAAAETAG